MSGSSNSSSGFDSWREPVGAGQPGGSGAGGGGGGGGTDICAIFETAILASPVAEVIASLGIGSVLTVGLETNPRNRVVVITDKSEVAGAITSPRLVDIIECMNGGHTYEAEITSINGGRDEVEIRPT